MSDDYYVRRLAEPSNSTLKHLRRSPWAYWDHIINGETRDTGAMRFGRAFHLALLERATFDREHFVFPAGKFSALQGKIDWVDLVGTMTGVDLSAIDPSQKADDLRADVCAELERNGRAPMSEKDLVILRGQVASLNRPEHEPARRLLTMCQSEVTVRWRELDLDPKSRIDLLDLDHLLAGDVKTTDDADPDEFRRSVLAYGYHYQEAMYRRAVEAAYGVPARYRLNDYGEPTSEFGFLFLLVGKSRPHHWSWATIDPQIVVDADEEISRNLETLRQCITTDTWPGRWTQEPVTVRPWRKAS